MARWPATTEQRARRLQRSAVAMLDMQPRLLDRAAEILGGGAALSRRLGIPEGRLRLWQAKHGRIPDEVFLSLVDIVLRDDVERAAEDRRREPRRHAVP